MATINIVSGGTYKVVDGAVYTMDPSLDDDVKFVAAHGQPVPVEFTILMTASPHDSDYSISIYGDDNELSPTIDIADGVHAPELELRFEKAFSSSIQIGENVEIGKIKGSEDGIDTLSIGNGAILHDYVELRGGADTVTIGDDVSFLKKLTLGKDADEVTSGNNVYFRELQADYQADMVSLGTLNITKGDVKLDGKGHGDNPPDILSFDSSNFTPAQKAALIEELEDNGYVLDAVTGAWVAGPGADYHIEIDINGHELELNDWEQIFIDGSAAGGDGIVEGTAGADLIDIAYTGDPEGDMIDNNDAILPGEAPQDDIVQAFGGNDTILSGEGDDTVYAGGGNDTVDGGTGNDEIYGDSDGPGGGAPGPNLIVNGSFEDVSGLTSTFYGYVGTGAIPGWTTADPADEVDVHNDGRGGIDPTDGNNWLDLEASPGDIRLGQDVAGVADGQSYELSFDAGDGVGLPGFAGENQVNVYWGGDLVATIDPPQGAMQSYSFTVQGGAGDGSNRLEFEGTGPDDKYGVSIDSVSLVGLAPSGPAGNDTLSGGDGDDLIFGEGGNDTIDGGDGSDTIDGGEGDDTITGGAGADDLKGGDDQDTFKGSSIDDFFGDFIDGGAGGTDFDIIDLTGAGVTGSDFDIVVDGADSNGNGIDGRINWLDGSGGIIGTTEFREIEKIIPCFTPGTMIATATGERPVEDLRPGDRIITRDNGIQEIAWAGSKVVNYQILQNQVSLRPVLIRRGALGRGLPERDMLVSPNHRVLMANDRTQLLFAEAEVLVPAKHLVGMEGISRAEALGVTYVHFMFEHHEVILSDGTWTESFQPGEQSLKGIDRQQRAEILRLFPELATVEGRTAYTSARSTLKQHEADILAGRTQG